MRMYHIKYRQKRWDIDGMWYESSFSPRKDKCFVDELLFDRKDWGDIEYRVTLEKVKDEEVQS
jgi:hypothetical protein